MNNKFTYLLSLLTLLSVSLGASAQNVGDYQSVGSGKWSTVANWQVWNGSAWVIATNYPSAATAPANFTTTIVSPDSIAVDVDVTVYTVKVNNGAILAINNGGTGNTFTQNQGSSAPDMFVDNTGTLKLGGLDTWTAGTGSPTATINGVFVWSSGTLGVVTTTAAGSLDSVDNQISPQNKFLTANFTNGGTLYWQADATAGGIVIDPTVTFTNAASGVINENFSATRGFGSSSSGGTVINNGIINKFSNNELKFQSVAFTNNGTIRGAVTSNAGTIGAADFGGTIAGSTGTLAPGNGTLSSMLTLDPALITGQTPTLSINITSTGDVAGTNYDQAVIGLTGTVDISGTTLNVTNAPTAFDAAGTVYTVLSAPNGIVNGGTTAHFAAVNLGPGLGNVTVNATNVTVTKIVALPLTWGAFDASAQANGTVSLKWTTLQESNTAHFVIERNDGSGFASIGTVAAAGNSSQTSQYSFVDAHPTLNGTTLYRLQEVDLDGKINYSSIRAVSFKDGQLVKVLANPNPAHDLLNLNVQGDGLRALFVDALGHTLHAWILQNGYQQVNIQDVPAGEYQLLIYQNNQKIDVQHIVKF